MTPGHAAAAIRVPRHGEQEGVVSLLRRPQQDDKTSGILLYQKCAVRDDQIPFQGRAVSSPVGVPVAA